MNHLFVPFADNGMGLSRISYTQSMFILGCSNVMRKIPKVSTGIFSNPSPTMTGNAFTNEFLLSDCDAMLLIDADLIFQPQHVDFLFSHDIPFVGGLYPQGKPGLHFPVQFIGDENPFRKHELDNTCSPLVEVKRVARGFTLYKREVFEKMIEAGIAHKYFDEQTHREQHLFWDDLPGGHSEDFRFCDKWRSIGGKVMVDQRIVLQHEKTAIYPIKGTYPENAPC